MRAMQRKRNLLECKPRWRSDGKELFFHFGDGFFAADVKADGKSFAAGIPRLLFEVPTVSPSSTL